VRFNEAEKPTARRLLFARLLFRRVIDHFSIQKHRRRAAAVHEIVEAVNELKQAPKESKRVFLEELVVRRELSFNFTRHNAKYDSL
jgi:hypothetical protein